MHAPSRASQSCQYYFDVVHNGCVLGSMLERLGSAAVHSTWLSRSLLQLCASHGFAKHESDGGCAYMLSWGCIGGHGACCLPQGQLHVFQAAAV
jgi:hypothetical protein